jgi:acetyltransferase-like isoleucine patch superfamily enzyme
VQATIESEEGYTVTVLGRVFTKVGWMLSPFTRVRWERRFGRLGKGSVVKKPRLMTNPDRIFIGDGVFVRDGSRLEVVPPASGSPLRGHIVIADHAHLEDFVHLAAVEEVVIGEGTVVGSYAYITDHDHGRAVEGKSVLASPLVIKSTRIGKRVWIGERVCILKGVTVGDEAILGAGAVVTNDVARGATVVGVPAREIRAV